MKDLKCLRNEIDSINDEMVELFIQRLKVSKAIGKYKIENGMEIFDSSREEEIINRMCINKDEEYHQYIKKFMKELMNLSKEIQKEYIDDYEK